MIDSLTFSRDSAIDLLIIDFITFSVWLVDSKCCFGLPFTEILEHKSLTSIDPATYSQQCTHRYDNRSINLFIRTDTFLQTTLKF